jgi:hypothetical protein
MALVNASKSRNMLFSTKFFNILATPTGKPWPPAALSGARLAGATSI